MQVEASRRILANSHKSHLIRSKVKTRSSDRRYTIVTRSVQSTGQIKQNASIGKIFGAIALVTGSTVGAGILALPTVSAEPGFFPSASVLIGCWAVLSLEALLIAEVNLKLRQRRIKNGEEFEGIVTLTDMAGETIGQTGKLVTTGVYMFLVNTLLVAYTSKAGQIASSLLPSELPGWAGNVMFVSLLGTFLASGNKNQVQNLVRGMTLGLITSFLIVVISGGLHANFDLLDDVQNWSIASTTFPIMFLSLVYHDLVPLVCKFLNYDRTSIRLSLLLGSMVPLSMFLSWDAVALSLAPAGESGLDPLVLLTQMEGGWFGLAIQLFSLAAISSSWMGSSLGMSAYLKAEIEKNQEFLQPTLSNLPQQVTKCLPVATAVLPPLYISLAYPDIFLHATEIAGGYLMTFLYGVLPPIMAWQFRNQESAQTVSDKMGQIWKGKIQPPKWALVPGGRPVLAGLTMGSIGLEVSKALSDGGVFLSQFLSSFVSRGVLVACIMKV
eukprot:TRINITY_DN5736_c1_g2_i1.p1 TRINITY_DN5736_c1_g2~~TRINITY_DN5736_c1_g2_i1.p1  ORF type:complete len:520 (+),score=37.80 TRINITY_DN5736_c1_g2_i1:72-1562(+)